MISLIILFLFLFLVISISAHFNIIIVTTTTISKYNIYILQEHLTVYIRGAWMTNGGDRQHLGLIVLSLLHVPLLKSHIFQVLLIDLLSQSR